MLPHKLGFSFFPVVTAPAPTFFTADGPSVLGDETNLPVAMTIILYTHLAPPFLNCNWNYGTLIDLLALRLRHASCIRTIAATSVAGAGDASGGRSGELRRG
jgi:hypothetical protein